MNEMTRNPAEIWVDPQPWKYCVGRRWCVTEPIGRVWHLEILSPWFDTEAEARSAAQGFKDQGIEGLSIEGCVADLFEEEAA